MMLTLRRQAAKPLNDWSRSAILGDRGVAARNFADLVAARMVGTVLPFSERESLVRAAARHGINRFEANLLIATVQHQLGVGQKRLAKGSWLNACASAALPVFAAIGKMLFAAVQFLWQLGRQWAIKKRVWPGFRIAAAVASVSSKTASFCTAVQDRWFAVRRWAIENRVWPGRQISAGLTAIRAWIVTAVQNLCQATRQWAIENGLWPTFRFSSVLAGATAGAVGATRDRPGIVRPRAPKGASARIRISSTLVTFVAVQAGSVAAVWYLLSY
jgi:hypothetical protein